MDSDKSPARLVLQPTVLSAPRASGTQPLVATVIVVGALYFGRDVFVPLALAGLLSFALAPLIAALRRRGLPRTPAVLTVVILAFLGIFVFGFVVAGQVSQLGASLPRYEYNIREKVRSLQSSAPGGGLVERAGEVLRDLRQGHRGGDARRRQKRKARRRSSRKPSSRSPSRFKSGSPTLRRCKCCRPSSDL